MKQAAIQNYYNREDKVKKYNNLHMQNISCVNIGVSRMLTP